MANFKRAPGTESPAPHEPSTASDWIGTTLGGLELSSFTMAMIAAMGALLSLLIARRLFRRRPAPSCDWQPDDEFRAEDGYTAWVCLECGIGADFPEDEPPEECLRDAAPTGA